MKETAPTYEEFYNQVKEYFWDGQVRLTEKEVDEYLKSEEKKIKEDYQSYLNRFNNGEITRTKFLWGCAGAVGNCLDLMY